MRSLYDSGTRWAFYRTSWGALVRHEITAEIRPVRGGKLTTEHLPVPEGALEVSFTGEVWRATRSGSRDRRYADVESGGQTIMEAPFPRVLPGSDLSNAELGKVETLWNRFHLSGMTSTCAHQARESWVCSASGQRVAAGRDRLNWYRCECGRQRWDCEIPCYRVPGSHPFELVPVMGPLPVPNRTVPRACRCGEPQSAPVHGYRAGSGWLVEILAPEILASIRALFRIPEPETGTCDTCGAAYPLGERGYTDKGYRCGDCGDCSACCPHEARDREAGIPVHAEPGSLAARIVEAL